jgi:hypothetical protein
MPTPLRPQQSSDAARSLTSTVGTKSSRKAPDRTWHESSVALAQGLTVEELPLDELEAHGFSFPGTGNAQDSKQP